MVHISFHSCLVLHCMTVPLLFQPFSIDDHLCYFLSFANANTSTANFFLCIMFLPECLWEKFLELGFMGQRWLNAYVILLYIIKFSSIGGVSFCNSTSNVWQCLFSRSLPSRICFSIFAHFRGRRWNLDLAVISILLTKHMVKHLFIELRPYL